MLRSENWSAIWYKCLACQKFFQFPDRLIAHRKSTTSCADMYKNVIIPQLETDLENESDTDYKHKKMGIETTKFETGVGNLSNFKNQGANQKENFDAPQFHLGLTKIVKTCKQARDAHQKKILPRNISKFMRAVYFTQQNNCNFKAENNKKNRNLRASPAFLDNSNFCYFCNKEFTYNYNHERHLVKHTKERPYRCNDCDVSFGYACDLKNHFRKKHMEKSPDMQELVKQTMKSGKEMQPEKLLTFKETFRKENNNEKQTKMKCSKLAGKPTNPSKYLVNTNQTQFGASSLLTCTHCNATFSCPSTFKIHMLTHSQLRAFKCQECGKGFCKLRQLNRHILRHRGLKPHKCEECSWSFFNSYELKRHRLTHIKFKPFQCGECGKRFGQMRYLTKHMLKHSEHKS